jgi:hypothetical protein
MLERGMIQLRGFKNVSQDGKIVGFRVAIRSLYYRGVWLSQLRPATVIVDGEKFEGDKIAWTISGKTYAQADLANYSDVNWPLFEAAILTISKPGGLKLGVHEVEASYAYSASYMPPSMDTGFPAKDKKKMALAG